MRSCGVLGGSCELFEPLCEVVSISSISGEPWKLNLLACNILERALESWSVMSHCYSKSGICFMGA